MGEPSDEELHLKTNMDANERVVSFSRSFFLSRGYTAFCILLVVSNVAMFVWEMAAIISNDLQLFNHSFGTEFFVFLSLEIALNGALLFDIMIRILAQQADTFIEKCAEYTNYWGNIADVVILLFSLMALFVFLFGSIYFEIIGEAITIVLACFRWITLFLRIVVTIKNQTMKLTADKIEIDANQRDTVSMMDEESGRQAIESENIFDSGFDLPEERQYQSFKSHASSSFATADGWSNPATTTRNPLQSLSPTASNNAFSSALRLGASGSKEKQAAAHVLSQGSRAIGVGSSSRKGLNSIITEDSQFSFTPSPSSLSSNTFLSAALPSASKGPKKGGKMNEYQSIQTVAKTVNSIGHQFERDSYS